MSGLDDPLPGLNESEAKPAERGLHNLITSEELERTNRFLDAVARLKKADQDRVAALEAWIKISDDASKAIKAAGVLRDSTRIEAEAAELALIELVTGRKGKKPGLGL